jgi:hypothetical protein
MNLQRLIFFLSIIPFWLFAQPKQELKLARQGNKALIDSNFVEAELLYRQSLDILDFDTNRYNLALALAHQKKYDKAIIEWEAVKKTSNNVVLQSFCDFNIGNSYFLMENEHKKALEAYKDALRSFPKNDMARHNYWLLKMMMDQNPPPQQDQNQNQDQNQDNQDNNQNKDDQKDQNKGDQNDQGKDQKDRENSKDQGKDDQKTSDNKNEENSNSDQDQKDDSKKEDDSAEDKGRKDEDSKEGGDEKSSNSNEEDKDGENSKDDENAEDSKEDENADDSSKSDEGEEKSEDDQNAEESQNGGENPQGAQNSDEQAKAGELSKGNALRLLESIDREEDKTRKKIKALMLKGAEKDKKNKAKIKDW